MCYSDTLGVLNGWLSEIIILESKKLVFEVLLPTKKMLCETTNYIMSYTDMCLILNDFTFEYSYFQNVCVRHAMTKVSSK